MTSVLIVDDEALLRTAFSALIDAEDDLEVLGEAADGRQAVELATRLSPDVVVMDVRMPVMDGIEATRRITSARGPQVLILTTFDLAQGLSNAELAQTLHVSLPTAKTHVSRILTKLGARDRTQLVVRGYESGLTSA